MEKNSTQIKVKIVTPEKIIQKDYYDQATIPTTAGEIGILARHTPLVAILKPGEIRLKKENKMVSLAVSSGFVEVRPNSKVVILTDTAEHAEEIDVARAKKARERAEKAMKEKQYKQDVDYARLQALIEKETARIKVGSKYKK